MKSIYVHVSEKEIKAVVEQFTDLIKWIFLFLLFPGNLNVFRGKGDLNSEIRGKEKNCLVS